MARHLKKAQLEAFRYKFDIELHHIELHVPEEFQISAYLQVGARRAETKKLVTIASGQPIADF